MSVDRLLARFPSESRGSIPRIIQHEVMKPDLLRHLAGRREQVHQQLAEVIGPDAVEVVLPLAARLDQPRDTQQGQVMADRGLALAEPGTEVGHMELTVLGEEEE